MKLIDSARVHEPGYQAFLLLRATFVAAPILFGLDKFTNWMTEWTSYLAPWIADLSPFDPATTMKVVGVIEVCAGILVLLAPRVGAYVVAAWLAGIIVNLLTMHDFYDVALRDFGLFMAALALARLAQAYASGHRHPATVVAAADQSPLSVR